MPKICLSCTKNGVFFYSWQKQIFDPSYFVTALATPFLTNIFKFTASFDDFGARTTTSCYTINPLYEYSHVPSCWTFHQPWEVKYQLFFENVILFPQLFWPTVRKNCSSDREKLLKFEDEGWEFTKILRSLEKLKGQNNFWYQNVFFNLFLEVSHI